MTKNEFINLHADITIFTVFNKTIYNFKLCFHGEKNWVREECHNLRHNRRYNSLNTYN